MPIEANKYSGGLGNTGGAELFKLQTTYAAMYANPAKKAEFLKEIVDIARSKESDKEGWAIAVSGIAKYSHNPVEELGSSGDPFAGASARQRAPFQKGSERRGEVLSGGGA